MADGDTPRLTATFVPTHHLQLRHGFGGCTGYAVQRNFQPPEILLGPTQVLTVHLRYVIGYPDYHIPNRFKQDSHDVGGYPANIWDSGAAPGPV